MYSQHTVPSLSIYGCVMCHDTGGDPPSRAREFFMIDYFLFSNNVQSCVFYHHKKILTKLIIHV
jgi:hypothetical protein